MISPTDPVAVLSMLKNVRVPESLQVEMQGEALFNDGVGVVLSRRWSALWKAQAPQQVRQKSCSICFKMPWEVYSLASPPDSSPTGQCAPSTIISSKC